MTQQTPLIDYATAGPEQTTDRLLRRIVAWGAILKGGWMLLQSACHVFLAMGWAASPPSTSWSLSSGWLLVLWCVSNLAHFALLTGGVMLLGLLPVGILIIRISTSTIVLLTLSSIAVYSTLVNPTGSYWSWSNPMAAVSFVLQHLDAVCMPVLLFLLTLPPLARRMIG